MTCKDCIYKEACNQHLDEINNPKFTCATFKDRSKFIELPEGTLRGRLVDADVAIKAIAKAFLDKPWGGMNFGLKVEEIIDNMPTILQAEE